MSISLTVSLRRCIEDKITRDKRIRYDDFVLEFRYPGLTPI